MVITRVGQLFFNPENCEIKICFVFLTLFRLRPQSCEAVPQNLVFLKILNLTCNFRTWLIGGERYNLTNLKAYGNSLKNHCIVSFLIHLTK